MLQPGCLLDLFWRHSAVTRLRVLLLHNHPLTLKRGGGKKIPVSYETETALSNPNDECCSASVPLMDRARVTWSSSCFSSALDSSRGGQQLWIVNCWGQSFAPCWGKEPFAECPRVESFASQQNNLTEQDTDYTAWPKQRWQLGFSKPLQQSSSDQTYELRCWFLISHTCSLLVLSFRIISVYRQILSSTS